MKKATAIGFVAASIAALTVAVLGSRKRGEKFAGSTGRRALELSGMPGLSEGDLRVLRANRAPFTIRPEAR